MYELPKLNYSFNALEPNIDATTMEIHYSKHHQTYCHNFNAIMEKYPELATQPAEEIIKNLSSLKVDVADKNKVKNQGGGYINHGLFWKIIDPANVRDENLASEVTAEFGSVEKFKELFTQTAVAHFASGWVWLVRDENNKLKVYSLPNQDSPLTLGHTPILTLDVWEHAYYLKYQNRRAEYITNWWNLIKII
jgi:Fe-Mn family superoxide dismutase